MRPVTAWGKYDIQTTAGLTWAGATGTWDEATGTWDRYAPQYREEVVVHGCGATAAGSLTGGLVFARDPSLLTYDNQSVLCYYQTHLQSRGEIPYRSEVFHRFGVEYMNVGGSAVQVIVGTDEWSSLQFDSVITSEGNNGTIQNGWANFRLHGTDHGFTVQCYSPVAIRSMAPELLLYGSDDREGQP